MFCENCGKQLEEGTVCTCRADAARPVASNYTPPQPQNSRPQQSPYSDQRGAPVPSPYQPQQSAPPPPSVNPVNQPAPYQPQPANAAPQQPYPPYQGQNPDPNYYNQQQSNYGNYQQNNNYGQSGNYGAQHHVGTVNSGASPINEILSVLRSLFLGSNGTMSESKDMSVGASFILLGVEAAAFLLMLVVTSLRGMAGYFPIQGVFTFLLIIAIQEMIMFLSFHLSGIIFKCKSDFKTSLATVAIASVPWSCAFAVTMVLNLILGGNYFSSLVVMAVIMFAVAASICILCMRIKNPSQKDIRRLLCVALTYAFHIVVVMLVCQVLLMSMMGSMMSGLAGLGGFGGFGSLY